MACRECITGALHEGTPVGREETVHGLPTYITEPPPGQAPKGIIVFLPDAVGWNFNNNRILADKYAKRTNSRVYLPDFMGGHVMDKSLFGNMDTIGGNGWMVGKMFFQSLFYRLGYANDRVSSLPLARVLSGFIPFIYHNRLAVTKPRVYKFFHELRANEAAALPVGAAGFCWGGKYVFLLCSDSEKAANGKSLVDCGFTAHPSNLVIPADANAVTLPLSVCVGDVDMAMPIGQVEQTKKILEEKGNDSHEVVVVPGAKHGFAVRAKPDDEKAVAQGVRAEEQAVGWFNKWFGKASQ